MCRSAAKCGPPQCCQPSPVYIDIEDTETFECMGALLEDVLRVRVNPERTIVQVPVAAWEGKLWVRISTQYYNEPSEYQRLARAVMLLGEGG